MVRVTSRVSIVLATALAACSEVTFEGGVPVRIELTADRTTVTVGGNVRFTYEVVGTFLDGVVVTYGDGAVDSVGTAGAQSASGYLDHVFGTAATYEVEGKAVDAVTGTAVARVTIQVTGGV